MPSWKCRRACRAVVTSMNVGAATAIPAILMTMFGGAVADRFNKKYVLMTTSMLVAIMMMLLAFLDYTDVVLQWHVILIAAIVSFISGFDWPTRQSIFPKLIDREDMLSAVALNSIIWQSSRMVMPALGGILLAFTDTWLVFLFCRIIVCSEACFRNSSAEPVLSESGNSCQRWLVFVFVI